MCSSTSRLRKKNINQVITPKSIEPLLYALLWTQLFNEGPDKNQAEIAQLLVEHGFMYLQGMFHSEGSLPLSSKRTIEEAVDLSKYMVSRVEELRKVDRERREHFKQIEAKEKKQGP